MLQEEYIPEFSVRNVRKLLHPRTNDIINRIERLILEKIDEVDVSKHFLGLVSKGNKEKKEELNKEFEKKYELVFIGSGGESTVFYVKDKGLIAKVMPFSKKEFLKTKETMHKLERIDKLFNKERGGERILFFPPMYSRSFFIKINTSKISSIKESPIRKYLKGFEEDEKKDSIKEKYLLRLILIVQPFIEGKTFDIIKDRWEGDFRLPNGETIEGVREDFFENLEEEFEDVGERMEDIVDPNPSNFIAVTDNNNKITRFFYIDLLTVSKILQFSDEELSSGEPFTWDMFQKFMGLPLVRGLCEEYKDSGAIKIRGEWYKPKGEIKNSIIDKIKDGEISKGEVIVLDRKDVFPEEKKHFTDFWIDKSGAKRKVQDTVRMIK